MEKKDRKFVITMIAIFFIVVFTCLLKIMFTYNEEIISLYLYIIIYILITSLVFIKERKNIINIKIIFLGMYTIMIALSPVIYYLYNKTFISNTGNSIIYQFPIIIIGYLSMIIGFYIIRPKKIKEKKNNILELEFSRNFAIIILCLSTFSNIIFILKNRGSYFGGNLVSDNLSLMSGNGIINQIIGLDFIGLGLLYNYYYNTKKSKNIFFFFLLINIMLFVIRGNRTSVVVTILYLILIKNSYIRVKAKNMLFLAVVTLATIAVLGMIKDIMSSNNANFSTTLYNELQIGSINLNYVYLVFPNKTSFQYGKTYLINFIMLRPGPDDDFTLWLKKQIGLSFIGGGVTPTLLGEGYMNFGYVGIFLLPFIVGIISNILNQKYMYNKKEIAWITCVFVKLIDIFRGGIANSSIGILILLMVYIFYKMLFSIKYGNRVENYE